MALVCVRLTAQLGDGFWALALHFIVELTLAPLAFCPQYDQTWLTMSFT